MFKENIHIETKRGKRNGIQCEHADDQEWNIKHGKRRRGDDGKREHECCHLEVAKAAEEFWEL